MKCFSKTFCVVAATLFGLFFLSTSQANDVFVDNDSPNFDIEITKFKTKVNGGTWATKGQVAGTVVFQGAVSQQVGYSCVWAVCSAQRRFKLDLIKEMPGGDFKECTNIKLPYTANEPSSFDSWYPANVVPDLGDIFQAFKDCNLNDPNCSCTWQ